MQLWCNTGDKMDEVSTYHGEQAHQLNHTLGNLEKSIRLHYMFLDFEENTHTHRVHRRNPSGTQKTFKPPTLRSTIQISAVMRKI